MESYLDFCLNFMIFEAFFGIVFRIDFWTHFLTKTRSKMNQKDVVAHALFSTFFEVAIFCGIVVAFGVTFDRPLAPFGLILAPFWLILGPFWHPSGSYWDPFGPI